jgi:phosphatidate cytidylyltransferase
LTFSKNVLAALEGFDYFAPRRGGLALRRFLTGVVGVPIVLACLYFGGFFLVGFVTVCSVMMIAELRRMFDLKIISASFWTVLLASAFLVGSRFAFSPSHQVVVLALVVLGILTVGVFCQKEARVVDLLVDYISVFYVALMFSFLIDIRHAEGGLAAVVFLFLIVWIYDTGAYFFGIRFGKHKMSPILSPKKSWEGFGLGLVTVLVVLSLVNFMIGYFISWPAMVILILITAVTAQVGDLIESFLKRQAGVKDSGNFLPGHGGFLDRFDSFLCAAPIYYLALNFLLQVM